MKFNEGFQNWNAYTFFTVYGKLEGRPPLASRHRK
jgi:hypothetical protein